MEEKNVLKIIVVLNDLKHNINPSLNNKYYQEWVNRGELEKNYKFRDWVIEDAKKEVLKIIDLEE